MSYCDKLPDKYNKLVPAVSNCDLKALFSSKLPPGDRKEVNDEFKKTLVLSAQKSKNKKYKPIRKSKKALSAKERRTLGLYRLPKKGLLYSSFIPLHSLWTGYMDELLALSGLESTGWQPSLNEEPRQLQLQTRLCRADLHGALVKVTAATCPSHINIQGIVVMETKNTLQIISKDNHLRYIPKLGSSFSFKIKDYVITIPGSSIDSKPGERATKKLKNKLPLDF